MTKKILIVDDEVEDLNTMKSVLEKERYEITTASDGAKALDALTGNGFDLAMVLI